MSLYFCFKSTRFRRMNHFMHLGNLLAYVVLVFFNTACQQPAKPQPPAGVPPFQAPEAIAQEEVPELNIMPFPKHFTLHRRDLRDFDGTADVKDFSHGQKTSTEGLSVLPVLSSRFGCYTMGAEQPWHGGGSKNCLYNQRFSGADTFVYKDFILSISHDASAFKRPIISVWKTRGDSLDFYTILNKCFEPDNEGCEMKIDSILPISSKKHRVFGKISWDSMPSKRASRTWSAVWTLPDQLELR